jgi:hypothetical protein
VVCKRESAIGFSDRRITGLEVDTQQDVVIRYRSGHCRLRRLGALFVVVENILEGAGVLRRVPRGGGACAMAVKVEGLRHVM